MVFTKERFSSSIRVMYASGNRLSTCTPLPYYPESHSYRGPKIWCQRIGGGHAPVDSRSRSDQKRGAGGHSGTLHHRAAGNSGWDGGALSEGAYVVSDI